MTPIHFRIAPACIVLAAALIVLPQPLQAAPQLSQLSSAMAADESASAGAAVTFASDRRYQRDRRYRFDRRDRYYRPGHRPDYRIGLGYGAQHHYPPPRFGSYNWWVANDWFSRDRP